MLDILITGGEVYDGTGGPPVRADVGIAADRVARIGPSGADGPAAQGAAGPRCCLDSCQPVGCSPHATVT